MFKRSLSDKRQIDEVPLKWRGLDLVNINKTSNLQRNGRLSTSQRPNSPSSYTRYMDNSHPNHMTGNVRNAGKIFDSSDIYEEKTKFGSARHSPTIDVCPSSQETKLFAATKKGLTPLSSLTPSFTKNEEKIFTYIKNRNFTKLYNFLRDYKFLENRNFWVELQTGSFDIIERLSPKLNINGIVLGMLFGIAAFGSYNIMESFRKNREQHSLIYICIFKNALESVPSAATKLLFKIDLMSFISSFRVQQEQVFLCQVLNAKKKQNDVLSDVNALTDAYNIYGSIESENFNLIIEYLMTESNKKIAEVANLYYKTFGLSITEHACMNNCKPFLIAYIRHTILLVLSPATYMALTMGQVMKTKKSYNCCFYLLMCIFELKLRDTFDIFKEYYDVPLTDKLREYIDSSMRPIIENLFETYGRAL